MKSGSLQADHYIKNLIGSGENQHLDFKFEISDARKIARTFSAFANTGGGILLIGVKDNGRISGIRTEEEIYMAESAAHLYCRPAVDFRVTRWHIEGRVVLEINIPRSLNRPHFARGESDEWNAYVRVGDQNIRASRILVKFWRSEGNPGGVMLNFGREEKMLMSYLEQHGKITFTRFTIIARTGRAQAERILLNLMLLKIIRIEITEKTTYYTLHTANTGT